MTCADSNGQAKGRPLSRNDFLSGRILCYDGPYQDRTVTRRQWGNGVSINADNSQSPNYTYYPYKPPGVWIAAKGLMVMPQCVRIVLTGFVNFGSPYGFQTCDPPSGNNPHMIFNTVTGLLDSPDVHAIDQNEIEADILENRLQGLRGGRTFVMRGDKNSAGAPEDFDIVTRDSPDGVSPFITTDSGGESTKYIGCNVIHLHVGCAWTHQAGHFMQPVVDMYHAPDDNPLENIKIECTPLACTLVPHGCNHGSMGCPEPCELYDVVLGVPFYWSCTSVGQPICINQSQPNTSSPFLPDAEQYVVSCEAEFKAAYPNYAGYTTFLYTPEQAGAAQFLQDIATDLKDYHWSVQGTMESFNSEGALSLIAQTFRFNEQGKDLPLSAP